MNTIIQYIWSERSMLKKIKVTVFFIAAYFIFYAPIVSAAQEHDQNKLEQIVHATVSPLLKEYSIPGMAVAITFQGKQYFFNYGVASKESGKKVTENTFFEVGSISKIFTAMLASYAQAQGIVSLDKYVSQYMPELQDSPFDKITLLELGTYTAGGLPLQFPEYVHDKETMIDYYKKWKPLYPAGTYRLYSNPSIGLLGYLTAQCMRKPFESLLEEVIFPKLGLSNTYVRIPHQKMENYAYGYSKSNDAVRVTPGVLDAEAYGVKTTASDLLHFLDENIKIADSDPVLQQAIQATQLGYYKVDNMIQGLGWEMYSYPSTLEGIVSEYSADILFNPNKATKMVDPLPLQSNIFLNKSGSTNGFGAYIAFVPSKKMGIVLLANKNYPNIARVKAAVHILTQLDAK